MSDRPCAQSDNELLRPRKTDAKRQSGLKGCGQAAIFGIEIRAMVEKGCGLQAWQMSPMAGVYKNAAFVRTFFHPYSLVIPRILCGAGFVLVVAATGWLPTRIDDVEG